MKRIKAVFIFAIFFILITFSQQVSASPDAQLNWGSQVNAGQCDQPGQLVINVTHRVTNDVDSGQGGNDWAIDEYNRHIQVWQVDANTFCADVRYLGSFTTVAGTSPGATDNIAAGIEGTFEGGYRGTIVGTLKASPPKRTRGNLGSFDYGCQPNLGCTSLFSWLGTYFSSASFSFDWWGWIYHGGNNGVWVNSSDGNQGDITD